MSGKVILLAVASLILAMAGGGAWAYYSMNTEAPKAKKETKQDVAPLFVKLEPLVVNLQGEQDNGRFLQVELNLKVEGQDLVDSLKAAMPELRHRVILILSSKKAGDLDTLEKKLALAEEIRRGAAAVAGSDGLRRIKESMFLSFVMQ